jgi:hypothetical protein
MRHLVRHRDPGDTLRAIAALVRTLARGGDPYGCVPAIIQHEQRRGVRSSFQIAVARRHPRDVNYSISDERTCRYLSVIRDAGFELCLHGSYRSTERAEWYVEEAVHLRERLGAAQGSRQHFLAFRYDTLFSAQEQAGITYDMSLGFPDQPGPRAGFSYPYFPYCVEHDRPYDVLQLSLFLMDVTLRGYLGLKAAAAWPRVVAMLDELRSKGGCVSIVWHPIVFAGARDPGYDQLFWRLVDYVCDTDGLATDGRTINDFYRERARTYSSFARAA